MKAKIQFPLDSRIRFHLVAAPILFALDSIVIGQGVFTFFVAFSFLIRAIFSTGIRALKRKEFSATGWVIFAIYFICTSSGVAVFQMNKRIAKHNAEVVIAAVKAYEAKYKHCPKQLNLLVPEFLPEVPVVKYTLNYNGFTYYCNEEHGASLMYVELPPFGRPYYNFKEDRWGYLD